MFGERWIWLDILSSKPYTSVIQEFVAYLIKDNTLNDFDCNDPGRIVSREPNIQSGYFNNAEKFSIDVYFITFYSIIAKM